MTLRRLFWVALGAAVGIIVVHKVTKAAEAYTPEGLRRSVSGVAGGLRDLADAVREGMVEREQELRIALGVDAGNAGPGLEPEQVRQLLESPARLRPR
jgi:hypothetical protein